jgi:hypothetical protein
VWPCRLGSYTIAAVLVGGLPVADRIGSAARLVLVLVAAVLVAPRPARADSERATLAVAATVVGGAEGTLSAETVAARLVVRAGFAVGLRVATAAEAHRRGVDEALRACALDAGCAALALRNAGFDFGLLTVVSLDLDPPLVASRLIDADSGRVVDRAQGTAALGAPLDALLDAHVDRSLKAAGHALGARLEVALRPSGASWWLADLPRPLEPTGEAAIVPAGRHRLLAEAPGHEALERELELAVGESRRLDLELRPAPSIWASPWLWVAVGVVAAGATTATLIATRPGAEGFCHARTAEVCP